MRVTHAPHWVLALESGSGEGQTPETCTFDPGLIVVRNSTERPEVIGTFATLVQPGHGIGAAARTILADVEASRRNLAEIPSPYGDGSASLRSLEALADRIL